MLKHLQEEEGLTPKDLCDKADKDKTTVTRILGSLENRGALRRQTNPSDRRSFHIFLTPNGKALIRDLQPIPDQVNKLASSGLTHEELVSFKRMLQALQTQISI